MRVSADIATASCSTTLSSCNSLSSLPAHVASHGTCVQLLADQGVTDAEAHLWRRDVLISSCCAGARALAGADLRRLRPLLELLLKALLRLLLVLVPEHVLARVGRQSPRPEICRLRPLCPRERRWPYLH